MESNNLLLLKTFTISLFIHILGISIFTIVFPIPLQKKPPIEVSLLPSSSDSKIKIQTTDIVPNLPTIGTTSEKLEAFESNGSIKIEENLFLGSPDYTPLTKVPEKFEIPEFKINFPSLPSIGNTNSESSVIISKSKERIEGPAGGRELIYKEKIEYPSWAENNGIEGNVKIKFWVEPDGKIGKTEIITSSGYPELDLYTISKFRKYLFQPINTNEIVWGIITFVFRLQ